MHDRFFETTREEFQLNHCVSCGLLFLEEEEIKGRLSEFYPSGYWWVGKGRSALWERRYREWMVKRDQLKFVTGAVSGKKLRLLDIGCGSGTFVRMARGAGIEAYGLEMSPEAVAIAETEIPGAILQGTEDDILARKERFDIVTMFHALEHMPDPFRFLKKLQGLLEPDGSLVVQVPNSQSLQARIFGSRWYGLDCPRHLYNYSDFSLFHLLGRAGYTVRTVRHFSLRDNAAAMASSFLPSLDPMSNRVKRLREKGRRQSSLSVVSDGLYFGLLWLMQPLALLEAFFGRGGTVTIWATRSQN